jgi:Tol biopolymer transport system component/predicted Ser/Thr protein kinase
VDGEDRPLDSLADAVLEGRTVDWPSAEAGVVEPQREAIRQLKVLAGIADMHKRLTADITDSARLEAAEERLEQWGRLKLLERIGRGSFGDVFRAWDSKLDREVAVKLLRANSAPTDGAEVLKEARLLARVRHPNVVTVYDADEIDGRVGLWMEFIHGKNLEQVLGERKRFEDVEVTRVGIELCRALSAVHDAGLLHRDVKTQNLMQAGDGRLVLMDFGTGWDLERATAATVEAAGTPLYLAPEIFQGAQPTVRTDIYSAGVLLFHLRTGAYPVQGATIREVGLAHESGERLDLRAGAAGVSRGLADTIGRAIHPDPGERFQTIRDMLAALENAGRAVEARKKTRYRLAFGAVSLAAVALVAPPALRQLKGDRRATSGAVGAPNLGLTPEKRAFQTPNLLATRIGRPSPDGRHLPYTDSASGNLGIYNLTTGGSRVLTTGGDSGQENYALESIVSADSRRIAYAWADGACHCQQLRVIDAEGTGERVLTSGQGAMAITPLEWSHDGSRILGTRQRSTSETDVVLVSAQDGAVQLVRTLTQTPGHLAISPDGRYVAYDRLEGAAGTDRGIYLCAVDGIDETPVVTGPTYDSHPMWTPDGSGLVFASMRTGGPGLWLQAVRDGRADGRPQLLDKDMGPFVPITLTLTGSLYYRHRTGLMDVYTVPIDPATGEVRGEPTNAAGSNQGSNLVADWSPDGDTIVYESWRTLFGPGRNLLVFHSMTTGVERELAADLDLVNGARWSPDGRTIAVGGVDPRGMRAIWLVDPASGRILSSFLAKPGDLPPATSMEWDPDGAHLYLRRNPGSISRLDIHSGEESVVYEPPPDSTLGNLSVSPDGRWLVFGLYVRPADSARLLVIPSGGGRSRELVDLPGAPVAIRIGDWTRDGKQILFVRTARDAEQRHQGELWAVPLEGGRPRSLGLTRHALRDVRVSPDGTRISFTTGYPDTAIWVFDNFLPQRKRP